MSEKYVMGKQGIRVGIAGEEHGKSLAWLAEPNSLPSILYIILIKKAWQTGKADMVLFPEEQEKEE